jgi:hypothetical protein
MSGHILSLKPSLRPKALLCVMPLALITLISSCGSSENLNLRTGEVRSIDVFLSAEEFQASNSEPLLDPLPGTEQEALPGPTPIVEEVNNPEPIDDSPGDEPNDQPNVEPTPAPSSEETPAPSSDEDLAACAKNFGVAPSRVHLAGRGNEITLGQQDYLFIKLTGRENLVNLNLSGDAGTTLKGLCVFVAGTKNSVSVVSTINIAQIFYMARGNLSVGSVQFLEEASLTNATIDLSGNGGKLSLQGLDEVSCPTARQRGHATEVVCAK